MATRKKTTRKKSSLSTCARSLGSRGGKKTLSLGHGIFADVYKKKRKKKKTTTRKKKTARKRTSKRKR